MAHLPLSGPSWKMEMEVGKGRPTWNMGHLAPLPGSKLDDEDGGHEMQPRSVEPVDDNDKQQVFTFRVPNEKHPWVFSNKLADPEFLKVLDSFSCGRKPKAASKRKATKPARGRRQARRAATGVVRPSAFSGLLL